MKCYNCGAEGASIETVGYSRHYWHQSCLENHLKWLQPKTRAPQRYIWWESSFDFDTKILLPPNKSFNRNV